LKSIFQPGPDCMLNAKLLFNVELLPSKNLIRYLSFNIKDKLEDFEIDYYYVTIVAKL
jgi:hypothetical protein